jgi:hypothetical protein
MMRNERVLHYPVWVSTNAGINLWMGNHQGATGAYRYTPEMEAASQRIGDEVRFDAFARQQALSFMYRHPAQALPSARSPARRALARLSDVFHALMAAGLVCAVISRRRGLGLPLAMLACFTTVYSITVASPRYLFPAMPWLMIAAASAAAPRSPVRDTRP